MSLTIHSEMPARPHTPRVLELPARPVSPTAPHEESGFSRIFRGLGREIDKGEKAVVHATQSAQRGVELGPNELLALQAGIYRYSEAVDLAAKLVDRVASGVKTVVAGQ